MDTLPADTNTIRTLTADQAQILARRTGTLSLNGLADLPDAIARLLIRRIAPLALDGLPALSLELAKTLARFHGELSLSGLSSLTPEAAAAIARHKGRRLGLDGLSSLPADVAAVLAQHKHHVALNGLRTLPDEAATALARHKGEALELNGLVELSLAAARSLATYKGRLCLDGLRALPADVAEALSRHRGSDLSLGGITDLTAEAATHLAAHKATLCLGGLASLADQAAQALSAHEGELILGGLTQLASPALAARLVLQHGGKNLVLDSVKTISNAAAIEAAKHAGPTLSLNGLSSLSQQVAEALATHDGELHLNDVRTLDDDAATAIARHPGPLSLNGLNSLTSRLLTQKLLESQKHLSLLNLTTLSVDAAAMLSEAGGFISLGLLDLPDDVAATLSLHAGGTLSLPGLVGLTDAAAAALAGRKGDLLLQGLSSLSDEAAEAFSQHVHDLDLYGVTTLSDAAVRSLASHRGETLRLGITALSDDAAAALADHRGKLELDRLNSISDTAATAIAKHRRHLSLAGLSSLSDAAQASLQAYHIELGNHARPANTQLHSSASSRAIRVFISSTFRDFTTERDLLVRSVFPDLRRRCRERHVELIDVDLRWGITEAETEQGQVLPICLAEIDRARPFFVGLLGERYGWTPTVDQFEEAIVAEHPWLTEHLGGKSVTELEILHGVLNNPHMAGHAFFYFRDPAWSREQGDDYVSEGQMESQKLAALKQRIRASGFPVADNYASPEEAARLIGEDLWRVIDERFPPIETWDDVYAERLEHYAFSDTRRHLYVGGERYFRELDTQYAADASRPILISGPASSGKTALLANWGARLQANHPEVELVVHYSTAHSWAADPLFLLPRIGGEFVRFLDTDFLDDTIFEQMGWDHDDWQAGGKNSSLSKLALDRGELSRWLLLLGEWAQQQSRRVVLILDGLDRLTSHRDLRWLPSQLPPGVMLVLSARQGDVLDAAREHLKPIELEVPPLNTEEQAEFVQRYLGRYRKSLTAPQLRALLQHPLSGDPCFLLTIVEELRLFGIYERLDDRLTELLAPPPSKRPGEEATPDDVFEHVLARLEADFGKERIARVMTTLWASRTGLSGEEVLAIADVPALTWAGIERALGELLTHTSSGTGFAHDYMRKAVEDRYALVASFRESVHQRFVDYFVRTAPTGSSALELPWHCQMARNTSQLRSCLTSKDVFAQLYRKDPGELQGYWRWLAIDASEAYEAAWPLWGYPDVIDQDAEDAMAADWRGAVAQTLEAMPYREREVLKLRYGLKDGFSYSYKEVSHIFQTTRQHIEVVESFGVQRIMDAMPIRHDVLLGEFLEQCGYVNRFTAFVDDRRACHPLLKANSATLIHLRRRAAAGYDATLGAHHLDTLHAVRRLADALIAQELYDEAHKEYQRVLKGYAHVLGKQHPETVSAMCSLARVLMMLGDYGTAQFFYRKALETQEQSVGCDHAQTLSIVEHIAGLLVLQENYASAQPFLVRAFAGLDRTLGPEHPATADAFNRFVAVLAVLGEMETVIAARRERRQKLEQRITELRAEYGDEHENTLRAISLLSEIAIAQRDYLYARHLLTHLLRCRREHLGNDHQDTLASLHSLAEVTHSLGYLPKAERLLRRALSGRKRTLGRNHEDTLATASTLAAVLHDQGNHADAAKWLRRAWAGYRKTLGDDDSKTQETAEFLAECEALAADDVFTSIPAGEFPDPPGTVVNSVGMKLVPIPAGEFLMGSPEDCPFGDTENEGFQHLVRITKPFLLGMHQVTQAQYEHVTGENPSFFKGPDLPVEHLSWKQARRFCKLLSALPEERTAGRRYRLPTEAEWEYACRAGTSTTFNTGDTLELHQARFATMERTSPKPTVPVGSYPPNAWGLCDMHGNVWEWTSDWFSADYFRESPADDPQGPATGTHHTLRGGSASVQVHECRSAIRGEAAMVDGPETESRAHYAFYGDLGIRVVCQQSG